MPKFTIDDVEYDTDDLDTTQKRIIALYQKAVEQESQALVALELARACRIEVGRKVRSDVLNKTE